MVTDCLGEPIPNNLQRLLRSSTEWDDATVRRARLVACDVARQWQLDRDPSRENRVLHQALTMAEGVGHGHLEGHILPRYRELVADVRYRLSQICKAGPEPRKLIARSIGPYAQAVAAACMQGNPATILLEAFEAATDLIGPHEESDVASWLLGRLEIRYREDIRVSAFLPIQAGMPECVSEAIDAMVCG